MWRIAAAMANAGNAHDALKIAKSIEKDGHRTSAISDIVNAQAEQGNFKEAFDTALLLKNVGEANYYGANAYAQAIAGVLTQLTKSGRAKEALESVLRFDDLKPQHQSLYCAIAVAQADTGDIQGARSTLFYAETDELQIIRRKEMARLTALLKQREDFKESRQLRAMKDIDYEIHAAHKALALAYARHGSFAEASNIAFDPGIYDKGGLIEEIGKVAAEAGHKAPAITWARAMSSPSDKAYGLIGVARALSVPKNKPTEKQ